MHGTKRAKTSLPNICVIMLSGDLALQLPPVHPEHSASLGCASAVNLWTDYYFCGVVCNMAAKPMGDAQPYVRLDGQRLCVRPDHKHDQNHGTCRNCTAIPVFIMAAWFTKNTVLWQNIFIMRISWYQVLSYQETTVYDLHFLRYVSSKTGLHIRCGKQHENMSKRKDTIVWLSSLSNHAPIAENPDRAFMLNSRTETMLVVPEWSCLTGQHLQRNSLLEYVHHLQVGRPRPNFAQRCWPGGQTPTYNPLGVPICSDNSVDPAEGRKSFPSGQQMHAVHLRLENAFSCKAWGRHVKLP